MSFILQLDSDNLLQSLLNRLRSIDKLLEHLVQAGQIVLPLSVVCDKALLLLQQHKPLLLQCLALGMFMFDTCYSESHFIGFSVLWEESEEFFD